MNRKQIQLVVLFILAAPLFGVAVGLVLEAKLAHVTVALPDPASKYSCEPDSAYWLDGADSYCTTRARAALTGKASILILALTVLLPLGYAALVATLGRSRTWLARVFPWTTRPALLALGLLLIAQAALVLVGSLQIARLVPISIAFWPGAVGVALAWVGLLILFQAVKVRTLEPTPVSGILLTSQMSELTNKVRQLAQKLGAPAPQQLIVGLDPTVFVTSMPLNLRGHGALPPTETLYLPACALRVLSEPELDAVIGHELGHFRGGDQRFTQRFIPSYARLEETFDSVSSEFDGHGNLAAAGKLAQIPAQLLVNGMRTILLRAVNNIRRQREFEADRAGVEVASTSAQATALLKISILLLMWSRFRSANARYVASGRARRNLSDYYTKIIVQFVSTMDRAKLGALLLSSRTQHPFDTHPVLLERLQALGVDAHTALNEAIDGILQARSLPEELVGLEETITTLDNDRMAIPGTPVTVDSSDELPAA